MANDHKKTWLITGSSTGFGRELAEQVLRRGDNVVATARRPEQLSDLTAYFPQTARRVRLDVTEPEEIKQAVETTVAEFGALDVLVNNAGYGLLGALEEPSDEQIRRQFETNVFGALGVMRAALPVMRRQRRGHILNLSSIGGLVGFPACGIYNAIKFALEGMSEALAKEAAPLGIRVTIVEPGAFRTDFNGRSLATPAAQIPDYAATSGKFLEWATIVDGSSRATRKKPPPR